ncbi:uncharacterized protein Z520_09665 [Fonsecaea multimorphosa CBS 102226]|uniref:Uncharacterized protein n=1 Tax=Fonsecaea multimorphosa CBS 102226 TaxID=1442371 RepID=A0A0D2JVS7_9EURO|nr:uncharacterized protein Z520_09665 [Fonsecaea multimorphosa CBS 102226]KIX94619.1 hypothetical protein Z520_09665 [Fonsecaea multimorphosa CBS 102226]OAL20327.1 hypothetical protein AYO22_09039 [Fonsecaea multimorphosa]
MPTTVLGIEELESQQRTSNGLLDQNLAPPRGLSGPPQNHTPDITLPGHQDQMAGQSDQDTDFKTPRPRLTIRELRQAAQKETLASQAGKAAQDAQEVRRKSTSMPQKKPSILGGLFQVREPTQIALNQVASQMIAQHGSTSATKVPNVRLEKMPDFVPKVNSRWDGIPENVKRRERREKEKEKERAKRDTFFYTDSNARSDDGKGKRRTNAGSRNSSSTTGSSFGAHGSSSGSQGASSRTQFYTQSVNSSGDLASQQRTDASTFSAPLTSSSALSETESLSDKPIRGPRSAATRTHYPHSKDQTLDSRIPLDKGKLPSTFCTSPGSTTKEYESLNSPVITQYRGEGEGSRLECEPSLSIPIAKTVPPHPTSPLGSSRDTSPTAPSRVEPPLQSPQGINDMTSLQAALWSSEPGVLSPSAFVKKKSGVKSNNAFLAGEAQELVLPDEVADRDNPGAASQSLKSGRSRILQDLEKRPDSSRDRLGLRASMLFSNDTTPWELQETNQPPPSSPTSGKHAPNTKTKLPKPFGRAGKEKEKGKAAV